MRWVIFVGSLVTDEEVVKMLFPNRNDRFIKVLEPFGRRNPVFESLVSDTSTTLNCSLSGVVTGNPLSLLAHARRTRPTVLLTSVYR